MKISERWLREWVDPAIDSEALVAQLSMAGLEVDSAEPAAPPFADVVVGEVLAVEAHPDADKLRVCRVADGEGEHVVVCGASNVVAGMKAPYARVGAVLPDGTKIRKAKLRGVESFGMLCGADELGLAEERDGLMALASTIATGEDLRRALALDDVLIDIDLTPNRGDCLGLRGIAREVAVLNDAEVREPEIEAVPATIDDTFPVTVSFPEGCPRYLGRVIRGVDVTRSSPQWMVEKLRRCGLRSIDPVVDVTNYVLLELGQPMHAFDLDRLAGGIDVRLPRAGERITLLDGSDVEVAPDTMLIADADGPVALAGIMGGERSGIAAVGERPTTDIFLECAFFAPVAVAGRARRYGLQTDASHRYERGVDFELQYLATERATRLLLDIVGGDAGPIVECLDTATLPERNRIELREARLARVLGTQLDPQAVEAMLVRLGLPPIETSDTATGRVWTVQAPSFRFDIEREADLVEEVARIHGYDNVEVRMPTARMHLAPTRERVLDVEVVRDALVGWGGQEILSYSFVDPAIVEALCPDAPVARLANPLSADLAVMRPSLWPGLVRAWMANRNRQQSRARLFEIGRSFGPITGTGSDERLRLGVLLAGPRSPESWTDAGEEVDFFDARGIVDRVLALTRAPQAFRIEAADHVVLHPGQSARVVRTGDAGEIEAGWLGRLHPRVQRDLDLPRPVFLVELDLGAIVDRSIPAHSGFSRYPSVRRDVAIELDRSVPAQAVLDCVRESGGALVRDVRLFDVFTGERLGPERRSLALGIVLQHPDRTLADEETSACVDGIVAALEERLGAVRR